jgi:hypothetical protein
MADKRETDFLAYVLAGFIIAIGGIAVGVASTNTVPVGGRISDHTAVTAPTGAAPAPHASKAPATPKFTPANSPRSQEYFL